jgi:hypothetical protein
MRDEKIYEYDLDVTGVTDSGVTLQGILSGRRESRRRGFASTSPLRAARQAG